MAFNFKVKASELITAGTSVSTLGATVGSNLQSAYNQIQQMSNIWIGRQFDHVSEACNKRTANFNNTIKILTHDLPRSMEQVAQKYAAADDEVAGSVTFSEIKTVTDITPKTHEPTQIEFDETQIQSYTEAFAKDIQTAISNVETLSSKIPSYWLGVADDAWRAQVAGVQNAIRGSANAVINSINTQSDQARLALSGAEEGTKDLGDSITQFLDMLNFG